MDRFRHPQGVQRKYRQTTMISIRDLTLAFGGRVIFDNINFGVSDNDKIGLVGRIGFGKLFWIAYDMREVVMSNSLL